MAKSQRLFKGVHLLHASVGERPLYLPLLVGEWHSVLMDTGCAPEVKRLILPALQELKFKPAELSFIINTHCDVDHTGGNHAMKQAAPQALLCCGDADREMVESPEKLVHLRYGAYRNKHNHGYPREAVKQQLKLSGRHRPVDLTFRGGERLRLGPDWEVMVLHLPGHSRGHIGLWDLKHRMLYGGDAIHGSGCLSFQGNPTLCPTYEQIDSYLATVRFIEHLPIDGYSGCHWPVKLGREIGEFCQESRDFVEQAEILLLAALVRPRTLTELCNQVGPQLGDWPSETLINLCYVLNGHLENLESRGLIRKIKGPHPARYVVTNEV